ncbi:MAG: hypothetical protein RJB61_1453 [Actinomycetota bacterium]
MQHDAGIADEAAALDRATLEVHHVADHTVVTDHGGVLGRGVQDAIVLDARPSTDGDVALVAAQHGTRPDARLGADSHVADDHGIGVHVCIGVDRGHGIAERIHGHGRTVPLASGGAGWSEPVAWFPMSRRFDIELTSARPDGTWTWRAAGAQQPKGVLDGALIPAGIGVGAVLRAEAENDVDGITVLSVTPIKGREGKSNLLALIPSDKPFEAVTQQLARKERGARGDRGDRRPGDRRDRGDRRPSDRGDRPDRDRRDRDDRRGPRRPEGDRPDRGPRPDRRPRFEAPPELPQRPRPKRLRPGRVHRNAVLKGLSEAERTIAERLLQGGIPAVRQALTEQNRRLTAEGQAPIDDKGILKIAEDLQPALRVAEWRDRADAAMADIDELDLRDLRSVVVAADDPMVARDDTTRELAERLKAALVRKQEQELTQWLGDIDAALGVGRVVRALKLSSQPPKAGVRFPADLAGRLAAVTNENLTADALAERWVAVLEAAAFSPIRQLVAPTAKPTQVNDELLATVKRLGPALPKVAALFELAVDTKAAQPKPLRPTRPTRPATGAPAGRRQVPPPPPAVAMPAQADHTASSAPDAAADATIDDVMDTAGHAVTADAAEPVTAVPDAAVELSITESVVAAVEAAVADAIEHAEAGDASSAADA